MATYRYSNSKNPRHNKPAIIKSDANYKKNPSEIHLTKRELEVLDKVILGYTTKEIGSLLCISSRTVETHINNLKVKLGCNFKREIISMSIKLKLIAKLNLLEK